MQRADAVFEGGGVKGIGFVGALAAFEEAGFQWQNVAGTSAGAITAALVAVGYTAGEIRKIMDEEVDFTRLKDSTGIGRLPLVGPYLSLLVHKGMYQGDYFLGLMRRLLSRKLGKERVTFADLTTERLPEDSEADYRTKYKYRLRVVASDISGNAMLVLPQDIARLGLNPDDLEVALAVRMSMSIPFFFRPVVQPEGRSRTTRHLIIDGGMLSNFPIYLFDSSKGQAPPWPTIGFLLWEPGSDNPRPHRIRGPISMISAMINTMTSAYDRKAIEEIDAHRLVKIPTGTYNATDFDLAPGDRAWLYNSGYQAAGRFLEGWSFQDYVTQRARR